MNNNKALKLAFHVNGTLEWDSLFKGGTVDTNPKMFKGPHLSEIYCLIGAHLTQIHC